MRVLELLENVSLAAKVLVGDDEHVQFFLDQLADPEHFRPLKPLDPQHVRALRFDPRTGQWQPRQLSQARVRTQQTQGKRKTELGHFKPTRFTKKTAVTLLPPRAEIQLFDPQKPNSLGFLFNLEACHLKEEKYIFPRIIQSDTRWWLHRNDQWLQRGQHRSISLTKLREDLRAARMPLEPNELLVGLSLDSLVGIFVLNINPYSRFFALVWQEKIKQKFKKELSLFLFGAQGLREYLPEKQQEDWQELSLKKPDWCEKIAENYPELANRLNNLPRSSFRLELWAEKDVDALRNLLSFLNLQELLLLANTSKIWRQRIYAENSAVLSRKIQNSLLAYLGNRQPKIPHSLVPHDYYNQAAHFATEKYWLRYPNRSLRDFVHSQPDHALMIMQSSYFSEQLPKKQRQLSSKQSRSKVIKILSAFTGLLLGLAAGLLISLVHIFLAVLRLLRDITSLGLYHCTDAGVASTSFWRNLAGISIFPLYSILRSVQLSADYGWKYGLAKPGALLQGLSIFQRDLYCPKLELHQNRDELYATKKPKVNLNAFFQQKNLTIADEAQKAYQRSPGLFFKAPMILPSDANEHQPLLG